MVPALTREGPFGVGHGPTSSSVVEVSSSSVAGWSRSGHDPVMLAESRSPMHSDLVVDLRVVREKGLGHLHYATPALTVACALYGAANDETHRPAAVEALLRQAVTKVGGGKSGEAASYTFGLVQGTKLWTSTDRRKAAAKAQGVSVERFRKGYEGVLIDQVAEGILTLLYESGQQRSAPTSDTESARAPSVAVGAEQASTTTASAERRLAAKLHEAGVIDFHLSRSDYTTTLAQFLEQAQSSVLLVSMSLKTKGAENEVAQAFKRLLAKSPQFRVIVSLIQPGSPACQAASVILGVPHNVFQAEVESMLIDLAVLRQGLPWHQASRLYLLQHIVIPSFSGILIDDGLPSARLQTETKLYDAPRSDSYGFTLASGGQFYERQRLAYYRILRDAKPFPEDAERPVLPVEP